MITLDFSKGDGLIPVVVQDASSNEVLMLAYINEKQWHETLSSGYACYWSRSRGKLWKKGEESGNFQKITNILVDCDADSIIYKVEQIGGAACHEGYRSCFFRTVKDDNLIVTGERVFDPSKVYHK